MSGLFEVLAADDYDNRRSEKRAVTIASKRASASFGSFLASSSDKDDFDARLDLIDDDLNATVRAACTELDHADTLSVMAAIRKRLEAAGGFCDDCRKWKSGPKAGCTCGSSAPAESDEEETKETPEDEAPEKGAPEETEEDDSKEASVKEAEYKYVKKRGDEWVIIQKGTGKVLSTHDSEDKAKSAFRAMEMNMHGGKVATEDNLGGKGEPSPKMDKKRWKPNALNEKGNLKPIKTEEDGSRWPTRHQDIVDKPDHAKPITEQTDAVTEVEKLPTAKGDDDKAGFDKKKNQEKQPTNTWHNKKDQANPVTSKVDPHKNPLRALVEQQHEGFIPTSDVAQAIDTATWDVVKARLGTSRTANTEIPTKVNPLGFHAEIHYPLLKLAKNLQDFEINGEPYSQVGERLHQETSAGQIPPQVVVSAAKPLIAQIASRVISSGYGTELIDKVIDKLGPPGAGAQAAPQQAAPAQPAPPGPSNPGLG